MQSCAAPAPALRPYMGPGAGRPLVREGRLPPTRPPARPPAAAGVGGVHRPAGQSGREAAAQGDEGGLCVRHEAPGGGKEAPGVAAPERREEGVPCGRAAGAGVSWTWGGWRAEGAQGVGVCRVPREGGSTALDWALGARGQGQPK